MTLALLTRKDAVDLAIQEYDRLGQDRFLEKYGFGESGLKLKTNNGRVYDAEAILAAAVGKEHPNRGPLKPSEFKAARDEVADKLDELGFSVVNAYGENGVAITAADIALIESAREKANRGTMYAGLSDEEREAFGRVHEALGTLGEIAASQLGEPDDLSLKLTSSFSPGSGVRGYVPKDLWFAVYPAENHDDFAVNPQVFMIVSERGIEYGYGAAVHPNDFSTPAIKKRFARRPPSSLIGSLGRGRRKLHRLARRSKLAAAGGFAPSTAWSQVDQTSIASRSGCPFCNPHEVIRTRPVPSVVI
jgi:hypothetical protein